MEVVDRVKFFANFERAVNKTFKQAWWLYYLGFAMIFYGVLQLVVKSTEFYNISQMSELSKSNHKTNQELSKEFELLVKEHEEAE